MKNQLLTRFQNALTVLMTVAVLFSCNQVDTFEASDLQAEAEEMAATGFDMSPLGFHGMENARTYDENDCKDFCIDPDNPEYSTQTAVISNNSGPQTRVFTYTVYNTLTGFELEWDYAASNNAGRQLKITVSGAGFNGSKDYTSSTVQTAGNGSNTFGFDASWAACGVVTIVADILEDGAVVSTQTTTYNLLGACGGCDDEFSAILDCTNPDEKTLTVTFTAENAGDYVIQGGLTSGAIISSAVATADFNQNTSHPSAGGPSNVTRWEGSLDDCETVTVTITYSGGNGVGSWSAKSKVEGIEVVNGESEDQECD